MMLSSFLVCALLANGLFWVAPTLFTDWRVRDSAVFIPGGRVVSGRCSDAFVINSCNLVLAAPAGSGRVTRTVHYAFVSLTLSQTPARIVADPKRPEWLTTDLGLDYFWRRAVSLLLDCTLTAAFLLGFLYQARAVVRAFRLRAWWHKAAMVPVPLKLVGTRSTPGGTVWTVEADSGVIRDWTMPRRAEAFKLSPADRVLGLVQVPDARVVVTDWLVRGAAVPIIGGRVAGTCDNEKSSIRFCHLVLTAPVGARIATRAVSYLVSLPPGTRVTAHVVADPQRPEWLTTDLGLDHLGERTRTLLLLLMLMLMAGLLGAGAWIIVRGCRAGASWRRMRRAEMVPVALTLTAMRKAGVRAVWTVRADDGRTAEWIVWGWAKPFSLDGDPWLVLGLRVAGGAAIMPLDAALRWVKLSRAERTTVLHAAARVTA